VVKNRQNKSPFASALGDWFRFRTYFLTGKASPNDSKIVIVVIIIVIGQAQSVLHNGGIIAQTSHLSRIFLMRAELYASGNRFMNHPKPMGDNDVRRM
jgi:hypothetical protein